jgi:hypothetical protein
MYNIQIISIVNNILNMLMGSNDGKITEELRQDLQSSADDGEVLSFSHVN